MRTPLVFAAFYILYVIGGTLAWWTINTSGLGAVFFPPAGLTVAALIALPRRRWPVIAVAVILGEITTGVTAGGMSNFAALAGFGAANFIGPVVGASVVRLGLGQASSDAGRLPDLGRRRDLLIFGLGAVVIGPLVSGIAGGITAWWNFGSPPMAVWPQWWLGDALGVVVVAPLLLTWRATRGARSWRGLPAVATVLIVWVGAIVTLGATDLPLMFLVLAGLVVAGVLFDVRSVALTGLTISGVVGVSLAIDPEGLISGLSPAAALTAMKLEFLVFVATAYLVAAETNERMIASEDAVHRMATVGELQRLLLPPLELTGPGFRCRGFYDAAQGDLGVGGDWYMLRPSSDGKLVFGVGDIVGHDVGAARSMAAVRSGLALHAVADSDPAMLLGRLDSFCVPEPSIRYGTAWIGAFDPTTRTLTYACGGHPPPLLVAGDEIARLDGANTALVGIPQGDRYSVSVHVPFGASILLYSDGLIETRRSSIDDGIDRLEAAVLGLGLDPNVLSEAMLAGSPKDDDTILAVIDFDHVSMHDVHAASAHQPAANVVVAESPQPVRTA